MNKLPLSALPSQALVAFTIDLADDRIVPNVLPDRVFERLTRHGFRRLL